MDTDACGSGGRTGPGWIGELWERLRVGGIGMVKDNVMVVRQEWKWMKG